MPAYHWSTLNMIESLLEKQDMSRKAGNPEIINRDATFIIRIDKQQDVAEMDKETERY